MKLMIVILNDRDTDAVLQRLVEHDYRATRIASTGGFLRRGNTTLLIGTQDDAVEPALDHIREACAEPTQEGMRQATVFVLDIERYEQL